MADPVSSTPAALPAAPPAAPAPTPVAPLPGSPEYNAAMAAKVDAAEAARLAADRPQWLPEKFKSPEDLAAAYAALESKLGKPKDTPAAPDAKPTEPPKAKGIPEAPADADAAAKAAVASAGLDFDALSAEFAAQGALAEESYQKLEAKGIPRNVVDNYVNGVKALGAQYDTALYSEAGNETQYNAMVTWATSNLSLEEKKAFNSAVDSMDQGKAKLAVAGLKARYVAANGQAPTLLGGSASSGQVGYASTAEMTADMRKPEYQKDPAFRARVRAKVAASTAL
jgi:hypothetical protein